MAEIALHGALRGVEGPSGSLAACLEQIDGSTVNRMSLPAKRRGQGRPLTAKRQTNVRASS
jgi:hypothetical protein